MRRLSFQDFRNCIQIPSRIRSIFFKSIVKIISIKQDGSGQGLFNVHETLAIL